jgi:hypothetical protein
MIRRLSWLTDALYAASGELFWQEKVLNGNGIGADLARAVKGRKISKTAQWNQMLAVPIRK